MHNYYIKEDIGERVFPIKQILNKTHQGEAPAGLTSENIVVAFKRLTHRGEQSTPPPNTYSTLRGASPYPSLFLKGLIINHTILKFLQAFFPVGENSFLFLSDLC